MCCISCILYEHCKYQHFPLALLRYLSNRRKAYEYTNLFAPLFVDEIAKENASAKHLPMQCALLLSLPSRQWIHIFCTNLHPQAINHAQVDLLSSSWYGFPPAGALTFHLLL
jgi:hypothetical protein